MNQQEQKLAKALNNLVRPGEDLSTDEYLHSSISGPALKIISKNGSENALDYTVECPNCGSHALYGTGIFMMSGIEYCEHRGCRESVEAEYTKQLEEYKK